MLVDVTLQTEVPAHIAPTDEYYQEIYDMLHAYEHPLSGIYIAHLNFNHQILNNIYEYPSFSDTDVMKNFINELSQDKKFSNYDKERMAALERAPNFKLYEQLLHKQNWKRCNDQDYYLNAYGVVDSPEQLLTLYDFDKDPRKLAICFTQIERDLENKGKGGGWRWHKWGPYLGHNTPTTEYLDDEEHINEVYVYHIYEILEGFKESIYT